MGKGLTATLCLVALAIVPDVRAQQPPIVTESFDGRRFQFPAGTDGAFVDMVMKQDALGRAPKEEAFSFRGQWQVTVPKMPDYTGIVLIDSQRRVTSDAAWKPTRSPGWPKSRGYVHATDKSKAEIILTNGNEVVHIHCAIQSSDLLHCYAILSDGTRDPNPFVLTRVGPGPKSLMSALP